MLKPPKAALTHSLGGKKGDQKKDAIEDQNASLDTTGVKFHTVNKANHAGR